MFAGGAAGADDLTEDRLQFVSFGLEAVQVGIRGQIDFVQEFQPVGRLGRFLLRDVHLVAEVGHGIGHVGFMTGRTTNPKE